MHILFIIYNILNIDDTRYIKYQRVRKSTNFQVTME
jgi:hypothetical protein